MKGDESVCREARKLLVGGEEECEKEDGGYKERDKYEREKEGREGDVGCVSLTSAVALCPLSIDYPGHVWGSCPCKESTGSRGTGPSFP